MKIGRYCDFFILQVSVGYVEVVVKIEFRPKNGIEGNRQYRWGRQ